MVLLPPLFAIYVVLLVAEVGGLKRMADINQAKADCLYSAIDASDGFYRGRARVSDRSLMNVAFNLPTDESERRFIADSAAAGFSGLAGHHAIGGLRASIYNAMTIGAVEELAGFMEDFQRRSTNCVNGSARSGKKLRILHGPADQNLLGPSVETGVRSLEF